MLHFIPKDVIEYNNIFEQLISFWYQWVQLLIQLFELAVILWCTNDIIIANSNVKLAFVFIYLAKANLNIKLAIVLYYIRNKYNS